MITRSDMVLVIDDFEPLAKIVVKLLRQTGYIAAQHCTTFAAAKDVLRTHKIRLVICDIESRESAFDFAREIRKKPEYDAVRILLTSARRGNASRIVEEGMQHLVDSFIMKPFASTDLQRKIDEINVKEEKEMV